MFFNPQKEDAKEVADGILRSFVHRRVTEWVLDGQLPN